MKARTPRPPRTPLAQLSAITLVLFAGSVGYAQPKPDQAAPQKAAPTTFAQVVTDRFEAWDINHDGKLTPEEIDKLCVDPKVKGPEAGAAAAIKRIVRSDKYELPPLTLDYLSKPAATEKKAEPKKTDADREDSTERDTAPSTPTPTPAPAPTPSPRSSSSSAVKLTTRPNYERGFKTCMDRIEKTDRVLYKSESDVTIAHCHQGPLGDCFFVSVVGALVKRDPDTIRKMIRERSDSDGGGVGGYIVEFGNGTTTTITPLTDAEIAISSTTSDEGLWLPVLEKAYGQSRIDAAPAGRYTMESATDAIAKGGSTAKTIRDLTGHTVETITLKKRARSASALEQYDENKRLLPAPSIKVVMEPAQEPAKLAKTVREKVAAALKENRLVAAGTGEEKQPPGISGKHAYAVIAYDDQKDTFTIWNPHGNTFRPRGSGGGGGGGGGAAAAAKDKDGQDAPAPTPVTPGLTSGYSTKAGVFELPVSDFVRIFRGVSIETNRVSAATNRKS